MNVSWISACVSCFAAIFFILLSALFCHIMANKIEHNFFFLQLIETFLRFSTLRTWTKYVYYKKLHYFVSAPHE